VTEEKTGTTISRRQAPAGVGILLALLMVGLYLMQVVGILDLGFFEAEPVVPPDQPVEKKWIQVYFTTPQAPDGGANHIDGLDEILAADIGRAHSSVDVAAYDFDLETVADALVDAHQRGVKVRFVTDTDNVDLQAVRQLKRSRIPVVEDGRGALMHNKFVVIDGEVVWTGSWNLTENGTYRNDNNAVRINSAELAENYTTEFEEMFVDGAFGPGSPANTPRPQLTLADPATGQQIRMENYFAPEDQAALRILDVVGAAERSIRFLAFSFTDNDLGELVKQQAKAGLQVQGVFEERGSDTEYSEYGPMRRARPPLDVLTDGNPYIMHHKVFIVDDRIVILGSFNFTGNAAQANDENLLIIYSKDVASLYRAEFERIYKQALDTAG
jgi:phosphatidylserine/phosphatidylglycerophosphate/cardiolipin synthase-like enzyme